MAFLFKGTRSSIYGSDRRLANSSSSFHTSQSSISNNIIIRSSLRSRDQSLPGASSQSVSSSIGSAGASTSPVTGMPTPSLPPVSTSAPSPATVAAPAASANITAPQTSPASSKSSDTAGKSGSPTVPPGTKPPTEPAAVINDNAPLFWQPNKKSAGAGFYSPKAGKNSATRLNAFRNVGRIIAICLLQNELCPITLSRHVIKYILNRPVKWHDLAFFDSTMYESLRKIISDAERHLISSLGKLNSPLRRASRAEVKAALQRAADEINEQIFKPLELTFNVDLPEDGGNYDLIKNGARIQVNCGNMYEFVKRYAEFRMVKHVQQCLEQLKAGVYDVLPANAFDGLNAEDFRLLLNGVADVNIHTLASYTTISDESKETGRRAQFEKWFWSTLDKMNQQEKQELLFFWTGSPFLPASEEGFQPLPTITLRPPSDQHLPTANTCINRLYIPMYSSKSILKFKLLQAIKTKTFGFV